MSILEALAAGTPTVCTDSLGIADDLRAYDAALVTDGSPQSLADAVTRALGGEATTLRSGGLRYLTERLDIGSVAAQLETLYLAEVTTHENK